MVFEIRLVKYRDNSTPRGFGQFAAVLVLRIAGRYRRQDVDGQRAGTRQETMRRHHVTRPADRDRHDGHLALPRGHKRTGPEAHDAGLGLKCALRKEAQRFPFLGRLDQLPGVARTAFDIRPLHEL